MTVTKIKSIGDVPYPIDVGTNALSPLLTAGAALGITGNDAEESAWLARTSEADGVASVRSIHGNTVVEDGALVPVNIEGFESTGFNRFDGTHRTEVKYPAYSAASVREMDESYVYQGITSSNIGGQSNVSYRRSPNGGYIVTATSSGYGLGLPVPVLPSTGYYVHHASATGVIGIGYYTDSGTYISGAGGSSAAFGFTTPADCRWAMIILRPAANTPTTYDDICVNLSDPTRNGTYEPYWQQQRSIPAGTLRAAGTVYDELTATERITRVGVVDLGSLTWTKNANWGSNGPAFYSSDIASLVVHCDDAAFANAECVKAPTVSRNHLYAFAEDGMAINTSGAVNFRIAALADGDAAAFKAAMSGVYLFYELATPTTTPIDPPLNMTYRTEQGGTERVIVPTGENSALPTIVAAQGYTAESLRDAALSAIAPVENGTASTNYGVGAYLVHGGQLCRVTTAIATGEAISIGTNVTATTVMAEAIALIAQ